MLTAKELQEWRQKHTKGITLSGGETIVAYEKSAVDNLLNDMFTSHRLELGIKHSIEILRERGATHAAANLELELENLDCPF